MTRLVSIDGLLHAPEEARISVYDRGFLYGDSVFETVRTYGGEPYGLSEHLARLERSAERVAIEMPISRADLALEVRLAIRTARTRGGMSAEPARGAAPRPWNESYARVILTRGIGPVGLDPGPACKPLRVILVEPLTPLPASHYRDGVSAITIRTQRAADATQAARGAKVGNYLASLLALRDARAAGAQEALVLDAAGHVLEGTTSNIFLVEGAPPAAHALVTPPVEAGILAGITRAHVMDLAGELGVPVRVEPVTVPRLLAATELFITSTLRELVPVVQVDGQRIGAGTPGPVTRSLHVAFRQKVGLGAEPLPWDSP